MMLRLLLVVATIYFANSTLAQSAIVWSMPASACTPDANTIKFDRHATTNGAVRHASGVVDRIILICPISVFNCNETMSCSDTDWGLNLTSRDTGGSTAFVRAQLYAMPLGGGAPVRLVSVSSNHNSSTDVYSLGVAFTHTFDLNTNVYWVAIDLDRATASEIEIAYSVALEAGTGASDIRLKHDIELLGHLGNGLGFYRFAYNGSDQRYVGVMAQEVEAVRPDAVTRGSDGYMRVFYGRLGLRMQTYEDWLAAGATLPQRAVAP